MVQQHPERSVTELRFRVARLRVRLRLVRSRCWSSNNNSSLNSSLSSIYLDSSSSLLTSPPLNTSSPMRRCLNMSDHSVNANEEFNSFFSSPTCASSSNEEISAPVTPKFEVTEDISSTHSEVKLAIYPMDHRPASLLEGHGEEVDTSSFPRDKTPTLPLNVDLFPPPPLPPRQNNRHTPPKLPPKLKKRTRLFENIVF